MKLNVLALVLGATAFAALAANAQTTVIEERHDPAVVIEKDKPDTTVTVKERGILGEIAGRQRIRHIAIEPGVDIFGAQRHRGLVGCVRDQAAATRLYPRQRDKGRGSGG